MIKTIAIKLKNPEPLMVTWELGRRCNYDCTYCEATRHNNVSKHSSLSELKNTFDFINKYIKLYGLENANINFTGGEPTVNPIFFDFVEYAKTNPNFKLGLTTNGAFSTKFVPAIVESFKWVTVSYHAESDKTLKNNVIKNILELHKSKIALKINVMMHADYWDECVQVCELLDKEGVQYNPRPIGDGNITRVGWFTDTDGSLRRTSHEYTEEQQAWYFKRMGLTADPTAKKQGTELGRNCCGGRCVQGKVDNQWQTVNLVDTHFKGWHCSVDRYFLHIDQETGLVYHHQTCQATHTGKKGAIGSLDQPEEIFNYVIENKNNIIVCPNDRCGCGMCIPKAESLDEYLSI